MRTAIYGTGFGLLGIIAATHYAAQSFYQKDDIRRLQETADAATQERQQIAQRADQLMTAFRVKLEPGTRQVLIHSLTQAVLDQLPTRDAREAYLLVLGLESRYGTVTSKSPAGAVGMAQIMPKLGRELATQCGLGAVNEADLQRDIISLYVGACHFRLLYEQYGGNAALAMAAYNSGAGRVSKMAAGIQLPEETVRYIANSAIVAGSLHRSEHVAQGAIMGGVKP